MGLEILVASKCKPYEPKSSDEVFLQEDLIKVSNKYFPERLDGYTPGTYLIEGEQFSFIAGSYSWYHTWRSFLCEVMLNVPIEIVWDNNIAEGPFYELINMSDSEGAIGPRTCAKLAQDFKNNEQKYAEALEKLDKEQEESEESSSHLFTYESFEIAFEVASDEGFVIFG